MDFVFVSLQRIDTDRESTSTSIAKELSKTHRVLYVNPPIDRKTWILSSPDPFVKEHIQSIRRKNDPLVKSSETNLWVLSPRKIIESLNWIPSTKLFCLLNKVNNSRFSKEIKASLKRQTKFNDFILVIDKDIFRSYYLKELLKPKYTIYLDRDYIVGLKYWRRHGKKLEPELISKCDAVVCNSTEFTVTDKEYNKNCFYIGNGANLNAFNPKLNFDQPEEFVHLERPLIGYVGALVSSRLDILLIAEIASRLGTGSIVLIGPQDQDFLRSDLHNLKNIHFIKKKHTRMIPSYLKYLDVCINPQLFNEITKGNFPLKILEYLAMGKPVVATATNTMNEVFWNHAYLANSALEFSDQIRLALREDSAKLREERIKFAKKYGWETVSLRFLEVVASLESNTKSTIV